MFTKALTKINTTAFVVFLLLQISANAQWTKTAGPPGMSVNHLHRAGSILYAGTSSKGVFRSPDNGVSWQAANNGIENRTVYTLISDATYVYAGTDNGVFRSSNGGASWQPANAGIENLFIRSFYIANGFLFAGTISSGLFRSSNQGSSWADANGNALSSSIIYDITFSAPHLVVVADNLIFYSDNNGDSWFFDQSSPFLLTGIPTFVTTNDSIMVNVGTGVYRSFDGGVHWGNFIRIDLQADICGLVRRNSVVFAGSKIGMYSSRNFGRTWTRIPASGLREGSWFNNHFFRSGNNFLLAYDEIGVAYSSNGGSNWNYTLNGFPPAATIDNALTASGSILICGTHGNGVFQSNNGGNSWVKIGTNNNADALSNSNIFSVLRVNNNIILAGTCSNGLYRSNDKGATWTRIRNGLPEQTSGFLCVNSLARTTTNILTGTDQGVYYSNDLGASWHASNITGEEGFNVMGVAANGSVACAAVESFIGTNKIYRSTNNGVTWTVRFETSVDDWACMASDGSNHFYAGTLLSSNYLSNNNGLTWQSFGPGIPFGSGGFAIGVLNNNVFVGNGGGIYFSNNNGASFTRQNTGLDPGPDNNSVQGFTFSSTHVYAGLFRNSVWRRPLSDFDITSTTLVATKGDLNAIVMPNPITGESKLTYHVAARSPVVINMYNANGNLTKNLVNAAQNAGNYSVYIRKNNLHEGNYFISVVIGNKHTTIPVVVK